MIFACRSASARSLIPRSIRHIMGPPASHRPARRRAWPRPCL